MNLNLLKVGVADHLRRSGEKSLADFVDNFDLVSFLDLVVECKLYIKERERAKSTLYGIEIPYGVEE